MAWRHMKLISASQSALRKMFGMSDDTPQAIVDTRMLRARSSVAQPDSPEPLRGAPSPPWNS